MYIVKKEFQESLLTFYGGRRFNMKFKDLPPNILTVLFEGGHPGIVKQEKKDK